MSLCLDCGLCCDGSLFRTVPVSPEEAMRLDGRVTLSEDRALMQQPCRALEGCRCTVYEARPSTCRTYRCLVLAGLESGRLTELQAREALVEVFALRAEVVRLNGSAAEARQALVEAREKVASDVASDELRDALSRLNRAALYLQLPTSFLDAS